jgi:N-acetylglucosaminyl-diphospho-decaprenol L-rhamnosyltransferase
MITLIVVNYRTAAMAVEAIRSARSASSQALEVVVVDNSNDATEASLLRTHCDSLLVSERNRGYAGGINDAMRVSRGDRVVITNPDVLFRADAIDELVRALDDAAVSGPSLFWDEEGKWHLPPGDLATGREMVERAFAGRSPAFREQWDRRRVLRRIAFWSLAATTRVAMLSGAVLAMRRDVFDRLEGFDERFELYFEENDFLRRAAVLRQPIVHVPSARCRHIYNQSAAQVAEEAAVRFAQSELRYLEKWNGPFAARFLRRMIRPLPPIDAAPLTATAALPVEPGMLVEASPLQSFSTAAGHFPEGREVVFPEEVLRSLKGELFVRMVDRLSGRTLSTYKITS